MKKKRQLNRISRTWNLFFILMLGIVALLILLPVLLIVIISFSSTDSISQVGYNFFPLEWSFEGYYYTFKMGSQLVYSYIVTIANSVFGTALGLLIMAMYAYVICQKRFWLERGLTWFLFFTMLFGGGLVPSYILNVRYYHLRDTFWILLIPGLLSAYWVIIHTGSAVRLRPDRRGRPLHDFLPDCVPSVQGRAGHHRPVQLRGQME